MLGEEFKRSTVPYVCCRHELASPEKLISTIKMGGGCTFLGGHP